MTSWDAYVAFRTRALVRMAALARLELIHEPHLVGAVSPSGGVHGGLLVTGPATSADLDSVLARGTPQWVALLPPAQHLLPEVAARGWQLRDDRVAMVLDDLARVAKVELPLGLAVQRVAVRPGMEGYPLEPALRLAMEYGEAEHPAAIRDLELEARLLRKLHGIAFLVALTPAGDCVATA